MKLHIPAGDVYLDGYINCDIEGERVFEMEGNSNVAVHQEEFEKCRTTLDKYFKYPFGTERRRIFINHKFDALKIWPFPRASVEEIVSISFIEHVTQSNALHVISEVERVLKSGGKWIVDFPDIKMTAAQYHDSDPELCMRLIYCNHKNEYSIHHWGYTEQTFRTLLEKSGVWKQIERKTIVKHDYPMIGMVCIKK